MPERGSRTETLRAGAPLHIGSVTLWPIERIVRQVHRGDAFVWYSADKAPHALVIRDAGGLHAVDVEGHPVQIDGLRGAVPGLDVALTAR